MLSPLQVNTHVFEWGARTYVMGILNITPDSFSDDGILSSSPPDVGGRGVRDEGGEESALIQAQHFVEFGADILDVGGESTRPGAQIVSADEELARVVPVVQTLAHQLPNAIISIDTYKSKVAEAALQAGAHIVNDVWGLRADPDLAAVVRDYNVPVILMHNRSQPGSVEVRDQLGSAYLGANYDNLVDDVKRELMGSIQIARKAGIADEKIILDPGIGFGKTVAHNLELIDRLDEIRALGYPVLLGPSRKSFIGYTLDLPADQRLEGTAATIAVGITRGADIIRVHDVQEIARVAKMTDALVRRG
jgi:dihydropteroate synthase